MVAIIRTQRRTAQPLTVPRIGWENPVTNGLASVLMMNGNAIYDPVRLKFLTQVTAFSGPIVPVQTPYGVAMGEPAFGDALFLGGYNGDYLTTPYTFVTVFHLKNGAITNANDQIIWQSHGGSNAAGGDNPAIYYRNTAGERTIGVKIDAQDINIAGVPDGLYTIGFHAADGFAPTLILNGRVVASGTATSGGAYFYQRALNQTSFKNTPYAVGMGSVLLKMIYSGRARLLDAIELTRNPWQIFSAGPK